LGFIFVWACHSASKPKVAYDRIVQEIRHGELELARADLDHASQEYGSKNEEWAWRFRILKAQLLVFRREYKEALLSLQESLPPSLAATDIAARKAMVEGVAYRYAQEFEDSEKKFIEAERLASFYQPRMILEVLNNRGALEVEEVKYMAAQETFQRVLLLARKQKDQVQEANALTNLGYAATKQEHFDEAIDWNQSALKLSRALGMKDTVGVILGNMGWNFFDLGDFENAMPLYKEAAEDSERRKIPTTQAYWLTGVANSHYALHDYESAQAILEEALKIARGLDEKSVLTTCLNDLSAVEMQIGRVDLAERDNKEALEIESNGSDKSGILDSQLVRARIQASRRHFVEAERLFRAVIQSPKADKPQVWEAQARLAKATDQAGKSVQAQKEYREAIGKIEAARQSLNRDEFRLTFLSSAIEFYDDYVDFLIAHGRSNEALSVAELSRARTLTEGLASTTAENPRVLGKFAPQPTARKLNASLLFYWVGHKQSYLWVISPAGMSYFKLPSASEIEPVVAAYRKAILQMHDAQDEGSVEGKKLYGMLVEPAKKLIPPGSQVIVLPSESLYGLNFETLIVPDPLPHFWIEDVTLTTGSSLTMLAASATQPLPKDKSLFLVGDTKPPNPPFAPLPQAAEEMKQVKKYFTGAQTRVLAGGTATPSAFLKSNPEQYSYLHFVTHGTASHTRPLESAVILSQEGDSYKLYARDIVQHRLNATLVTISACNGAGTRAYSGEGLVGLSWAFLRAGAHNVIGALWEVSDASTPQLMDAFYRDLFQGKDAASALRDAKLSLLHSADPDSVFKNPFYWAPFQLYAGS
jgi:CHAT domain-containing protein/Tfp pilus assembly protein PilF